MTLVGFHDEWSHTNWAVNPAYVLYVRSGAWPQAPRAKACIALAETQAGVSGPQLIYTTEALDQVVDALARARA